MLQDTIAAIEARIKNAGTLKDENREELLKLLAELKREVAGLAETHAEPAESIAGFAHLSAHEATRREPNPHLVKHSREGLASSVEEFEASHPKLFQTVHAISDILAKMGI